MGEAKAATPHAELLAQLADSRIPLTEREHAAQREIERLTAALHDEIRRHQADSDELLRMRAMIDGAQTLATYIRTDGLRQPTEYGWLYPGDRVIILSDPPDPGGEPTAPTTGAGV